MGQRTLIPDAGEVFLHELKAVGRNRLVMVLRSTGEGSCCPACGKASRAVHSRYCRHLSDLPWEGNPVRIERRVRRFFCGVDECGQHIFTERLPNTVQRHGRRTCRLLFLDLSACTFDVGSQIFRRLSCPARARNCAPMRSAGSELCCHDLVGNRGCWNDERKLCRPHEEDTRLEVRAYFFWVAIFAMVVFPWGLWCWEFRVGMRFWQRSQVVAWAF